MGPADINLLALTCPLALILPEAVMWPLTDVSLLRIILVDFILTATVPPGTKSIWSLAGIWILLSTPENDPLIGIKNSDALTCPLALMFPEAVIWFVTNNSPVRVSVVFSRNDPEIPAAERVEYEEVIWLEEEINPWLCHEPEIIFETFCK